MTLAHVLRSFFRGQKLQSQKLLRSRARRIKLDGPEKFLLGPPRGDSYRERPNRQRGLRKDMKRASERNGRKKKREPYLCSSHVISRGMLSIWLRIVAFRYRKCEHNAREQNRFLRCQNIQWLEQLAARFPEDCHLCLSQIFS